MDKFKDSGANEFPDDIEPPKGTKFDLMLEWGQLEDSDFLREDSKCKP